MLGAYYCSVPVGIHELVEWKSGFVSKGSSVTKRYIRHTTRKEFFVGWKGRLCAQKGCSLGVRSWLISSNPASTSSESTQKDRNACITRKKEQKQDKKEEEKEAHRDPRNC
eukprot:1146830-Pelagomonas_calceolata.AAC.1